MLFDRRIVRCVYRGSNSKNRFYQSVTTKLQRRRRLFGEKSIAGDDSFTASRSSVYRSPIVCKASSEYDDIFSKRSISVVISCFTAYK